MSAPPTVDSPDAVATLLLFLGEIDPSVRERGRRHELANRVAKMVRRNSATVSANVLADERLCAVELKRVAPDWNSICTCGQVHAGCEHAAALAFAWIGHLRTARNSMFAPLVGSPGSGPGPKGQLAAPRPPRLSFRQQWEPILADKLGRPLAPEEGAFLGQLSQVFHNLRQSGSISGWDLDRLGFQTRESQRRSYLDRPYQGWWSVPPKDPLELWQYIAHDIETSGLTVPQFMRPITDTAPVRERLRERMRRETVQRWTDRFNSLSATASARAAGAAAAQPEWLDLRLRIGREGCTLETRGRLPDAPWKPAPRLLLDRFAHTRPGDLAAVEASPAVFAFLAVCQDHARRHYGVKLTLDGADEPELVHRLISHPLARTLVVNSAGAPLVFATDSLAWELTRATGDARDYELALRLPGGAPLPPTAMHLPGHPDFYLHDGMIYRGPPSLDGSSAAAAIVPAEAIERPEALTLLHQFGTRLPPEIEARFVNVSMRARVECALELDDFENESLVLQLFAESKAPDVRRTWTAHGWNSAPALREGDPAAEGGKIHLFDLIPAEAVAARLRELKLGYDDFKQRWTRRVTRNFPEEFLAWREALPPEVEVFASGELASLLGAPVRASVSFELIETVAHRDWFDLALALKPEDTTLTAEEIALLLKARGKLVRLPGKGWRRLSVQLDGAPAAALEAVGFDPDSLAAAAHAGERQRFHALQLAQTPVADLLPESQAAALHSRAHALALPEPAALPAGLLAVLRPYQREGFHFLTFLSANRLGGVLADDMGLGKTLQALAWLLWLAERQPAGAPLRALVVCPKSVVGNWAAEAARFAPALEVVRFAPGRTAPVPTGAAGRPLLVTANYTQLRLNAEFFCAGPWDAVILDEGQFIKTPTSKVAQVARELPGVHRLVLTGTPIENRLLDLWSLFAFALPGLLGTQAAFQRLYAPDKPLALARLRTRVRHFLLRRTKAQVAADLPARTEEDVIIDLEGEQARLYQAELKRARAQLLGVTTAREFDKARFNILASLMRLRQICCHPALVDSGHRDAPSAKLEELLERLEELRAEGHQVLVFSQFVTMLELIRERLVAAGIGHLMLTGQTEDRETIIARFQSDRSQTVFLLSLKAAGFGLNLTAASYVILYDPWWNPAVEAQAIDRTHRIGQMVPVNAYRLIARGTVEEKIRALQREKAALAGAIVQEESLAGVLDLNSLRQVLG